MKLQLTQIANDEVLFYKLTASFHFLWSNFCLLSFLLSAANIQCQYVRFIRYNFELGVASDLVKYLNQ